MFFGPIPNRIFLSFSFDVTNLTIFTTLPRRYDVKVYTCVLIIES